MTGTILITGCSTGIGAATARVFAEQGWQVIATARRLSDLDDLARLPGVMTAALDVTDEASIDAAVAAGLQRFGRIDALINNAGFSLFGLFEATSPAKIREQFEVNVFGAMAVTRAVLPHLRVNKSGLVIMVSSGAGLFTLPMLSMYCASKFALEGFSEALSYELASQNIAVKIIEPHGGVGETAFGKRLVAEVSAAADGNIDVSDYAAFAAATKEAFARMGGARMQSASDVARAIYAAATDGTDRLRYPLGDDARGFVKARYTGSDQDYIDFMRAFFKSPQG